MNRKKVIVLTAFTICFFLTLSSADIGNARCICTCMNGANQPLCESALDLPPICPPRICPIKPPSIEPIKLPSIPPIGTRSCRMEQVLNPYTERYEWREVCR
jgi:hypothetical protein